MILSLFALALQAAAPAPAPSGPQSDEAMYRSCANAVKRDAAKGLEQANEWHVRGGGLSARACIGLAYAALERWEPAATAFEQAAREAETAKDNRSADLWVQSGNAWLAGDNPIKARAAFDAALVNTSMSQALRGEVHIDRARAGVAIGDVAGARADLDRGLELVPADPFGWYLSAALAIRQEAIPRAQQDIAKAVQLAPDDADVLLLAGTVAGLSGDTESARHYYERAIKVEPNGPAARDAQKALAANSGAAPAAPEPRPPAQP